eukprot:GFUD01023165.1.p1 GENE.GFUD01023165.1~~GFUD01023165.1.p1  ORF type:complete len:331 (-),score=74.58 GFUD01023165.1:65-1057(-)
MMSGVVYQPSHPQGWNGMTIKELLDKVDIDGPKPQEIRRKAKIEPSYSPEPRSAYLGPKLWEKPISLQEFSQDDFFVMNIEEFLAENNLQVDNKSKNGNETSPEPEELSCASPTAISYHPSPQGHGHISHSHGPVSPPTTLEPRVPIINVPSPASRPGVIVSMKDTAQKRNLLPKGGNEFLYTESKRAKLEREKEERRRHVSVDIDFSPEDLALATVPGADFDPKERAFDVDELRPQPIIRKRPKIFVTEDSKDDRYWEKRGKNNVAARRSREARRLKENQIALRAAYLERENSSLKKNLQDANFFNSKLAMERDILKQKLSKYETFPTR